MALPEPAATAVRNEPALAHIAAGVTLHWVHGLESRGRAAGIAYLIQRARAAQETSTGTAPA